uniref:Unknow n=1 Tax=Saccharum hybrid cultivar SP80-3280 TaxID=193079 RepID=A0A2R4QNI5_9POAL|nr:unknow [Saccharum hybrid cultivar SP80-3280]
MSSVQVLQERGPHVGKETTPDADLPPPPDSMTGGSGGRGEHESDRDASTALPVPGPCASTHRALAECHRRAARGPLRPEVLCRHLNRALAECVVTACCPDETDAVRTLCGSAGTALKREQCHRARIDLALCLEAHQEP